MTDLEERLKAFFENVNRLLGGTVFMPPYVKYYSQIPTDIRLRIADGLVREWLAGYISKTASARPIAILRKLGIPVSPLDHCVFVEDVLTLNVFKVNGHTWKVTEVDRQPSKKVLRIYFKRLD